MARRGASRVWVGVVLLALFAFIALFAPVLAPYNPRLPVARPLLLPDSAHLLGTNDLGQDVLSQLIAGMRTSVIVAVTVATLSAALSWSVGLIAGYFAVAEGPLMALTDLVLALPTLPLYLLVVTLIGPSRRNLVLALSLLSWPAFARMVRSVVLQTRSAPYVEAARAMGATDLHLLRFHLLPTTLAVLPTKLILTVRFAVFAETTLAFLGLSAGGGVSWGTMVNDAFRDPLLFAHPVWPWLALPPALAIMLLILATTWLSEVTKQQSTAA